MKKLKIIAGWVGLLAFMGFSVGFSETRRIENSCTHIDLSINTENELFFVTKEDVVAKLHTVHQTIVGAKISDLNTNDLEKVLFTLPEVKHAVVYTTADGVLHVQVKQRRPIVRVIPKKGAGFYIDEDGRLLPLSRNYAARVLVVNGNVHRGFKDMSMKWLDKHDSLKSRTLFDEIYHLASFIDADPFWKAQIQQAYVDENQDFSLIPRVGNHNIELGNTADLPSKFERLMIFYKEGLPYTNWNLYNNISLKFENQVVCTFKEASL